MVLLVFPMEHFRVVRMNCDERSEVGTFILFDMRGQSHECSTNESLKCFVPIVPKPWDLECL